MAVIITRLLDNPRGFKKNSRLAALAGRWNGIVHQEGWPADYQMSCSLKTTGRTIRGEGHVEYSDQDREIHEHVTIYGGFVHDRFLKMEYEMQNQPGTVQFGFTILELSPDGQTLSGPFMGYGALITRGMVNGTIQLHRQKSTSRTSPLPKTIV